MRLADPEATRVVIVDDDPDVRFLLATVLELDGRFEVVAEAADVDGALSAIDATAPGLVLVDLDLGGDKGSSLIRKLRRHGTAACVVVVTGSTDGREHAKAFNAGAYGVQSKFSMTSTMISELAALVERHRRSMRDLCSADLARQPGRGWPLPRTRRGPPVATIARPMTASA